MLHDASSGAGEKASFGAARRRVGDFLSPCSFWLPERPSNSAWTAHAPFAFWLIEAHRPATLVELGTHWGYSFFAFCQAVHALGLGSRCFAVDTWAGDDHAGRYGEEVFASVHKHNEGRYATFARLMRATFDAAAPSFADGSIDLLHIDGRHFYEDVRHDFDCWRSKLSSRAIVLFHDTAAHESEFGVHRLWAELRQQFPHFEFLHGHGLGILGVGPQVGAPLQALFEAGKDAALAQQIRLAYGRLGAGLTERFDRIKLSDLLALKDENLAAHAAELARLRELTLPNEELDEIKASASWRLTRPLRFAREIARLLVRPLRRR